MSFEKIAAFETRLESVEREVMEMKTSITNLVARDEVFQKKIGEVTELLGDNKDVLVDIGVVLKGFKVTHKWFKWAWPVAMTVLAFKDWIVQTVKGLMIHFR